MPRRGEGVGQHARTLTPGAGRHVFAEAMLAVDRARRQLRVALLECLSPFLFAASPRRRGGKVVLEIAKEELSKPRVEEVDRRRQRPRGDGRLLPPAVWKVAARDA